MSTVHCSFAVVLEWKYVTQLYLPRSKQKEEVRMDEQISSQGEDFYGDVGNHTQ